VLGAQLDLFNDRHLRLEDARRALAEGRTQDACRELFRLRDCYPEDQGITAELDLARTLMRRLGEIEALAPGERPRPLVELARATMGGIRAALLRRAAVELRQAGGPAALLDGKPASALLLEAGDAHTAWAIAIAAVRDSRRARFLAYLADVEYRLDHKSRALTRYREALALDPYDVDWDELTSDDVKMLPDIARTELELPDGVAWAAPVGVVLRVLPIGDPPALSAPSAPSPAPSAGVPPAPAALEHARDFLRALLRASHERGVGAIDARRQMRKLAPQLLAAYLERSHAAPRPPGLTDRERSPGRP
jgi:tetratricopeptide (TPR) repeat protein